MDEVARDVGRVTRLDIGQLGEQFAEDRPQLGPGHVRAEAEVPATAAEAEVRVGLAAEIEALGRVEDASSSKLPDE